MFGEHDRKDREAGSYGWNSPKNRHLYLGWVIQTKRKLISLSFHNDHMPDAAHRIAEVEVATPGCLRKAMAVEELQGCVRGQSVVYGRRC